LSERWQEFAAYADAASAEVAAGLLRSEGVPLNIASDEPMPGLIQGFRLMVPAQMLHLAALSGRLNAKLDLQLERAAPGSKSWRT
jgi:hypothetical protein